MRIGQSGIVTLVALLALFGAATLSAQEDGGGGSFGTSDGPRGLKWTGGNMGSALMNPGENCVACHSAGEGPRFTAAGTVYARLDEKSLDLGVQGAMVIITDAKGKVTKLQTNKSGNFFARYAKFSFPIKAKVEYKGQTRAMLGSRSSANCAACHTQSGAGGAPGRIAIP